MDRWHSLGGKVLVVDSGIAEGWTKSTFGSVQEAKANTAVVKGCWKTGRPRDWIASGVYWWWEMGSKALRAGGNRFSVKRWTCSAADSQTAGMCEGVVPAENCQKDYASADAQCYAMSNYAEAKRRAEIFRANWKGSIRALPGAWMEGVEER